MMSVTSSKHNKLLMFDIQCTRYNNNYNAVDVSDGQINELLAEY